MSPPSERSQLEFLTLLQRLLAEGAFTASYKFALLLALTDLAVEQGDDSGDALHVSVDDIAEKFIRLYWRQAVQHPKGEVLLQNTDKQAAVVSKLVSIRQQRTETLAEIMRDARLWPGLRKLVAKTVRTMPLFRLQEMGGASIPFLYENVEVDGGVVLRPGVAFCLRKFHGLIQDLVRGAWLRFVRKLPANKLVVGEATDLAGFMFGTDRAPLQHFVPLLRDLQDDKCFYCARRLKDAKVCVDHFVPWSLYSIDLGHNFVLADERCNSAKSDTLAALVHLEKWWLRMETQAMTLSRSFEELGIACDSDASRRVTAWAYDLASASKARLWLHGKEYEQTTPDWRTILPR